MLGELDSAQEGDGDTFFRRLVTRLRPSQLAAGEVAIARNVRMDESGTVKVRHGYENLAGGVVQAELINPHLRPDGTDGEVQLIGLVNISAAALASNVVTVTTSAAHGIPNDATEHIVHIEGTFDTPTTDPTGNRLATYASDTQFTFDLTGGNETYTMTGDEKAGAAWLTAGVAAIYGACKWSDPDQSNDDYLIIANNQHATAIKLADGTTTEIGYPTALSLSQAADLQQEFDTVVLRQDGATAWSWDGDLSGSPAFVKVSNGAYTQPDEITDSSATISTAGLVAMNVTSHGLVNGDKVRIIDKGSTELVEGTDYIVRRVDDDNFQFFADVDTASSGTVTVRKRVSVGGGYIHMPASAWGVYHQRRAWVPYTHDAASSPAARGVNDELIASDILDNSTYDPIGNQFRITAGTADFLVGVHPYDDDRMLVFMRNSIHYLLGVSGSLADVQTIQLTDEIGCTARKSIVTYANQTLFLSDSGVYAVAFLDALQLRGTDLPLSEAIESEVLRITPGAADGAVACYHDNRYYIAVPTDGSEVNNEVWVYNFINGGWESIDTVGVTNWGIVDLIPARSGKVNELYGVTQDGGVHKLESTGRDMDFIVNSAGSADVTMVPIPAQVRTRSYTLGTLERKKFLMFDAHIRSDSEHASDGGFTFLTEDPDTERDMGTLAGLLGAALGRGEGASIRRRPGGPRGYGAQLDWQPTAGRPELRAVGVRAVAAFNSITSAQ